MRTAIRRAWLAGLTVVWILASATACHREPAPPAAASSSAAAEPYVPGLGEIMSLQQMRHTKLWLAGQAANWDLAAYEVDELGEGFDDVVKLHPTHKDSPVAPRDAIPRMVMAPLAELRHAVRTTGSCGIRAGVRQADGSL